MLEPVEAYNVDTPSHYLHLWSSSQQAEISLDFNFRACIVSCDGQLSSPGFQNVGVNAITTRTYRCSALYSEIRCAAVRNIWNELLSTCTSYRKWLMQYTYIVPRVSSWIEVRSSTVTSSKSHGYRPTSWGWSGREINLYVMYILAWAKF